MNFSDLARSLYNFRRLPSPNPRGVGRLLQACVLCFIALVVCAPVLALPEFPAVVRTVYGIKPGGKIDAAQCALCHVAAGPPSLNPYGTDVKLALKARKGRTLTAEILHSIDSKDSDNDGFTNGAEIQADTLPGDPAGHPAGPPPAAPKQVAQSADAEINPFDIKSAMLAKHAQHPVIVHFPIALFVISLFFDVLGLRTGNSALRKAAYYNLVTAAVTGVMATATGLAAWQWQFAGAALTGNLLKHLLLAVVTTVLMFVLWAVRIKMEKRRSVGLTRLYIVLAGIALLTIALAGHIGGIISGVVTG